MRLDKILIREGLANDNQVNEALEYQRKHGGRLELHLFRFGYVDEDRLLKALSTQFHCKSVKLSGIDIPDSVLKHIPTDVAWSKLVIPFDFDAASNTLKIACENPRKRNLLEELQEIASGKTIELYIALGVVLKCAIVKYYRNDLIHLTADASLVSLMESESPIIPENGRRHRVLIFNEEQTVNLNLEKNLTKQGYDTIITNSIDQLTESFIRNQPDILLLTSRLVIDGSIPVFLIPDSHVVGDLTSMLKNGIEDVIPIEDEYEPLMIKMNRLRDRREAESKQRLKILRELGTHGSLEDMNVIDLLQTMGPSRKTARVSISAYGKQLSIYLDKGNIIYAECDDRTGADAVYQGIGWNRGLWCVDPINPDDLPKPNNFQPNESILIEGCRLLDEQQVSSLK
jgi:hypothetical protein